MTSPTAAMHQHDACTSELRQVIAGLYVQVRANVLDHPNYRLDVFLERLDRHGAEPGFAAVIAHGPDSAAIGYAYGNRVIPGDRWWKRINAPGAPEKFAGRDALAVKEIGVVPAWRGIGVSRQMHDVLLAGREEPHATLMVNPAAGDGKVLRLYEGWGYEEIGVVQPSPDSPWLVCMGKAVRT